MAQAIKDKRLADQIIACDNNGDSIAVAQSHGLIDDGCCEMGKLFDRHCDVDLIVLSMPTQAICGILPMLAALKLQDQITANAIITDVASTKQNVVQAVLQACCDSNQPPDFLNFVPSHPIAGAEKSGVTARNGELFLGHECIICQDDIRLASPENVNTVMALWQNLGATVSVMSSDKHDEILSLTSHLPHLLSYALTYQLVKDDENLNMFRYAAGGFRDFSRISASSPVMWHDIFLANKQAVLQGLENYQAILNQLKADIENDNSEKLLETFEIAKNAREYFGRLLVEKEKLKNL